MKYIGLFFYVSCLLSSCGKDKDEAALRATCIEAKYLGKDCSDVIQILTPTEFSWTGRWYQSIDTTYQNCVGVENLLEQYKDGRSFHFTVSSIDSPLLRNADCTEPKYLITINNYTDAACNPLEAKD